MTFWSYFGIVEVKWIRVYHKQSGILLQWWRDLFRCRIDLLNFSMGFNIVAPYMEFLHLNWYIAEWLGWVTSLCAYPSEVWHLCKWLLLICIFDFSTDHLTRWPAEYLHIWHPFFLENEGIFCQCSIRWQIKKSVHISSVCWSPDYMTSVRDLS